MSAVVLGIAGTAKNTGKTTTLVKVIELLKARGKSAFLTSIGYDGEDFDNITGLPKPRVFVPEGTMVASALPLLKSSPAGFAELKDTGIRCALGRVFTGVSTKPGKVVLAGPSGTRDLRNLISGKFYQGISLVDGAFSRLAPMTVATHLIIATGAAYSPDVTRVASQMRVIWDLFSLETIGPTEELSRFPGGLFTPGRGQELAWKFRGENLGVLIEGIVNPSIFTEALLELSRLGVSGLTLAFEHPIMMLLSGETTKWPEALRAARDLGHVIKVRSSSRLLGFTVNPYMPKELDTPAHRRSFRAEYLPAEPFLEDISNLAGVPCTDIMLQGTDVLEGWLSHMLSSGGQDVGKVSRV